MPVKRHIREVCPRCGQTQAKLLPDGSVKVSHECPDGPPGPPSSPRLFRPDDVVFIPRSGNDVSGPPSEREYVLMDQVVKLQKALKELVALKTLKDTQGKSEDYERRQPLAWEAARAVLTQVPPAL